MDALQRRCSVTDGGIVWLHREEFLAVIQVKISSNTRPLKEDVD
jgi:hypothetical protein